MIKDPSARRDYARKWVAARRKKFFEGKTCSNCGGIDRLELDHINPADKIAHSIWSWSEERRSEELAKCQILCYKCHKAKTRSEQVNENPPHGNSSTYKSGCRCALCREAAAEYQRRWQVGFKGAVEISAP